MKIRFAQQDDVGAVLEISKALVAESRFSHYQFNDKKSITAIETMIANPTYACILLAQRTDGKVVGLLAGYATEYFFCDAVVVQDRWFYVLPEFRGSSAAVKLLVAFRHWAEARNVDELNINMSVGIDKDRFNKLMTHMGFNCCGSNFSLPLTKNSPQSVSM